MIDFYLTPYLPLSIKWRRGIRGRGFGQRIEIDL
jgi:hypothetical protein